MTPSSFTILIYPGEHGDVVIQALKVARDQVFGGGRVQHVMDSLIAANPPIGKGDELQKDIKNAVSGCTNAGSQERRALEKLGFHITEDGKHLKLVFRGDDRYTFAMPKSGSDWRGMKNWISDVSKKLFK